MTTSWFDASSLPAGWRTMPIRRVGQVLNGGTPTSDPENWGGAFPFVTPPDLNGADGAVVESTRRTLSKTGVSGAGFAPGGSILVSTRAPIGHVGRVVSDSAFNQGCRAVVPQENVEPRYVAAALVAARTEMIARGQGTTFVELSSQGFASISIPLPSSNEQRAITRFLDQETAQIDALVAKQEEFIALMRERKTSATEILTSDLEWNVPLRWVTDLIQTGPFGNQLKWEEYEVGGTPVVNPSHLVHGMVLPNSAVAVGAAKAKELSRHALRAGDLVVARRGELGRCAVVSDSQEGYLCGTGSALVRLDLSRIDPHFAAFAFNSKYTRDALALASIGSTMANVNSQIIGSLRVPVPALEEQKRIVSKVKVESSRIDCLITKAEEHIALATERRAALITAAVTGKLDVRTARKT